MPGSDEGGSPSGFFTGGTGVTVYRGDAFPAEFQGNLFVGDVSNNVVHRARRRARRRAGDGQECRGGPRIPRLARQLFPPGADGQRAGRLPLGHRHVPRADRGGGLPAAADPQAHGRRQRSRPRPHLARRARRGTSRSMPKLGKATTAELVALLEHPNGWHRDTASRLLYQRQDQSAVAPLATACRRLKIAAGTNARPVRAGGAGALEPDDVLAALCDPEPHVREHALATRGTVLQGRRPRFRTRMAAMVGDPDPLVRYQLAFSLGALAGTKPAPALAALAVRDGADPWIRMAILSSVTGCAGDVFQRLAGNADFRSAAQGRAFLTALAAQTGAANRPADVAVVLERAGRPARRGYGPCPRYRRRHCMSKMSAATQAKLAAAGGSQLAGDPRRDCWPTPRRPRSTDQEAGRPHVPPPSAPCGLRQFDDVQDLLAELLASRQPPEVQTAAIETLASFDDVRVAAHPAESMAGDEPQAPRDGGRGALRPARLDRRVSRRGRKGHVGRADVDPARLELLKKYPDARSASAGRQAFRRRAAPPPGRGRRPIRRPCR